MIFQPTNVAELGFACMLGQELSFFSGIIWSSFVQESCKGGLVADTFWSYPLGGGKMCSLLSRRLRSRRRREARVPLEEEVPFPYG
jgi:hypothetical protein